MYTKLSIIKPKLVGCLQCNSKGKKLSMFTRLYNGFGGWSITKNGMYYFMEDVNINFDKCKKLLAIEKEARKEPDEDWRAELFTALSGATYQRQGVNNWVLVGENIGFA